LQQSALKEVKHMSEQEGKQVWTGPCVGGPMSWPGQAVQGESRFPRGFVYVDKPNQLVWTYDWDENSQMFFVQNETPQRLGMGVIRGIRDQHEYDVRVAEEEVSRVNSRTAATDQDR
jgi:hypothetical protein